MSTAAISTIAELEQAPRPIEGGGYELDEGELTYVPPDSAEQSGVIFTIQFLLRRFVDPRNLGRVFADTWFQLRSAVVRAPDVAFIPAVLLKDLDTKHALRVVPALVIEVLGPSQTARDLPPKIQQYREAGVSAIWAVDPGKHEVDVYGSESLRTLRLDDTLEAPDMLPGFSLPVSQIFEGAKIA